MDSATLKEVTKEFGLDYTRQYVRYAIDRICNSYKRKDPMSDEERSDLADVIVSRKDYLTISDIKLFVRMLLNNELITKYGGQEEGRLITVETSSIIEKLNVYERKRDIITRRRMDVQEEVPEEKGFKITGLMKNHDHEGKEMPQGWDYKGYWDNWYRTHLLDGSPAPEGFDPVKYWKNDSPSYKDVERIANKILKFRLQAV